MAQLTELAGHSSNPQTFLDTRTSYTPYRVERRKLHITLILIPIAENTLEISIETSYTHCRVERREFYIT